MSFVNVGRFLNVVNLEVGYVVVNQEQSIHLISIIDNNNNFPTNSIIQLQNDVLLKNLNGNQIWRINHKLITHSDCVNCIDVRNKAISVKIPNVIPNSINDLFNSNHHKDRLIHGFLPIRSIIDNNNIIKGKYNIVVMIEQIKLHTSINNKKHLYIICNANNIKFNIIKWNASTAELKMFDNISFRQPIIFSHVAIKYDNNYYFVIQPETTIIFKCILPIQEHLMCKKSVNYWKQIFSLRKICLVFRLNDEKIGINYQLLRKHAQKVNCSSKWYMFNSEWKIFKNIILNISTFCEVCKFNTTIANNKCEICNSVISVSNQKLICNVTFQQKLNYYQINEFTLHIGIKEMIEFLLIYKKNHVSNNFCLKELKDMLKTNNVEALQIRKYQQSLVYIIEYIIKTQKNIIFVCSMRKSRKMEQQLENYKYKSNKIYINKSKQQLLFKEKTTNNKCNIPTQNININNNLPKKNAFSILMSSQKKLKNDKFIKKKNMNINTNLTKINKKSIRIKNVKIFIKLLKIYQHKENIKCIEFKKLIKKNDLLLFNGNISI